MVGELLNVLEAHDAAAVACDGGEPRGNLMNLQRADRFEAGAGPAGVKGSRTHVIGAGDNGGGKQEGVFKRNAAQIAPKRGLVFRKCCFAFRLHLFIEPADQIADGHFTRADTGNLAEGGAGGAGILFRKTQCSDLLIPKPETAKKGSWLHFFASLIAGSIGAKGAAKKI